VREAFDDSLGKLGLDYVDLYLMHWPQASVDGAHVLARAGYGLLRNVWAGKTLQPDESPTIVETWKEMEKLLETGASLFHLSDLPTDPPSSQESARRSASPTSAFPSSSSS
jgi:aryl-alcohol dehydrogenase-like predicted oxidoreductase